MSEGFPYAHYVAAPEPCDKSENAAFQGFQPISARVPGVITDVVTMMRRRHRFPLRAMQFLGLDPASPAHLKNRLDASNNAQHPTSVYWISAFLHSLGQEAATRSSFHAAYFDIPACSGR